MLAPASSLTRCESPHIAQQHRFKQFGLLVLVAL